MIPVALTLVLLASVISLAQGAEALPDLVGRPLRSGASNAGDAAVVIGVEDYVKVPDVPYAARDAQAFRELALYTLGVPASRIETLISVGGSYLAARESMIGALERAGRSAGKGATVWVFFSGHGVADPEEKSNRLLLGDDVQGDLKSFLARGVAIQEIRDLAGAGGAEVVLILDACYSGAGRGGDSLSGGTHFVVPVYQERGGTGLEWNAAGPNELSGPLHAASHGAFSYFAIGALRGWADGELDGRRDGVVSAEEAQAYVQRALGVVGIKSQSPLLNGNTTRRLSEGRLESGPSDLVLSSIDLRAIPPKAAAKAGDPREIEPSAVKTAKKKPARSKKGVPCWVDEPCAPYQEPGFLVATGSGASLGAADSAAREALLGPLNQKLAASMSALPGGPTDREQAIGQARREIEALVRMPERSMLGTASYSLAIIDLGSNLDPLRQEYARLEQELGSAEPASSLELLRRRGRDRARSQRLALLAAELSVLENKPRTPLITPEQAQERYLQALSALPLRVPQSEVGARIAERLSAEGFNTGGGKDASVAILIETSEKTTFLMGFANVSIQARVRVWAEGQFRLVRELQAEGSSQDPNKARAAARQEYESQVPQVALLAIQELIQ